MKLNKTMAAAAGVFALLVFIKISLDLAQNNLSYLDNAATGLIKEIIPESCTKLLIFLAYWGDPINIAVLGLIFSAALLLQKRKLKGIFKINFIIFSAIFLNEGLKAFFNRPRPVLQHLAEAKGLSYPSGHAMISVVFYGLLIYLVLKNIKNPVLRSLLVCSLIALLAIIGIGRVYLGVHHPSDVMAGHALGYFWLVSWVVGLDIKSTLPSKS